jgi:hypothetical protein
MNARERRFTWAQAGILSCAIATTTACAPPSPSICELGPSMSSGDSEPTGWRPPSGPCALDPPEPSVLVVTTTDHSTGALTTVDVVDGRVRPDVAESHTDSIPMSGRGVVPVVHRRNDFFELFERSDTGGLRSIAQHTVGSARGANPQALVFDPNGLAFVTLLGEPWIEVHDPSALPGEGLVERIDLSAFADPDGNPDAGVTVVCGDTMYVAVSRLGPDFQRVDFDGMVAIDMNERAALVPERGPLRVRGRWIRQFRRDPTDPEGTTILALTTGIERIDLRTQEVTWAVPEDAFTAAGIDHFYLPQAFAVDEDGTSAYLAAYASERDGVSCACDWNACFDQVRLYRVGLDGGEPRVPEPFAEGFLSVGQTLERVGDRLWYGSTRVDAPGLWAFDTTTDPPTMLDGPISTGLPPYAMVALE